MDPTAQQLSSAPLIADRWQHAVQIFGTGGDPSRCWCQWFRMCNADWRGVTTAGNRQALQQQVAADAFPPGVLGYLDGVPVGWCAVAPRAGLPRLTASSKVRAAGAGDPGDPSVWAVTCFVVVPGARRSGLTGVLLRAALDQAREHGARLVEAYPVDTGTGGSVTSSGLYHGALSTFLAAGFTETGRTSSSRPVVSLDLAGGSSRRIASG